MTGQSVGKWGTDMAFLESLASGLRSAGSVLSPDVYEKNVQEDRVRMEMMERRRNLVAAQVIKGAESGAIAPEAAQATLQRLGLGDVPVGLGVEGQARQDALKQRQEKAQRQLAIRADLEKASPEDRSNPAFLSGLFSQHGEYELGAKYADTAANREAKLQQALMDTQRRLEETQMRMEDKALTREQQERLRMHELQLRRMIAEGQQQISRDRMLLSRAIASTRQNPIVQTADGIFERTPSGLVKMVNPETGQPLRPASITAGDRGDRRDSMSIYEKVESDPQVKTFKSIVPKYDTSVEYFNAVQQDPKKQSNAQDLAMVKTFVSMIHPKGDQISNMDMKNIGQLPGIDERIAGAVVNVVDGKQLQPKVRADIMGLMNAQFGNLNTQVIGIEDRRREEASGFGLDPDKAVPKVGRRSSSYAAPNGKSYSAQDVAAAAKQAGMTAEEFVRSRGLQSR